MLKIDPKNTELLNQKQTVLKETIAETSEKLKQLKEAQERYIETGKDLNTPEYRNLQREIINTENKLKDAKTEMFNFGSVVAQQIALAGEKVETFGSKIENIGKKIAPVSAIAATALVGITKAGMDFETAWTGVTKTVDGTDEELATVRQEILNLSKTTGTASEEIAGVAEAAGQLGVGVKDVSAFTETMVRLGDSTNLSADEAATAIAQFYNIMGQDLSTVDRFGSSLVALGNNSATSEKKIMDMASRIASSGSQIGLTSQQILALSASLSSVGLEAEGGGSAISQVMTQIDKDVALNSKNLKTWAKTSGMSVKDFSKLWKDDTMSALQAVIKGMADTQDEGGNLNVLLDQLGISSIRQTDTMKRLANASDLLNDSLNTANSAWDENTALTNESQKRYETTAAKIGQVKETFKEIGIQLAEVVLPVVQDFADKLKELLNRFSGMDEETKKMIVTGLAATAVLAPLLTGIGKLIIFIGKVMTYAPKIVSAIKTVKGVISAASTTIAGIGLVLAGVATAVTNFISMLKNGFSWIKEALMIVGIALAAIGAIILGVPALIAGIVAAVIAVVATLIVLIKEHWEELKILFTQTIPEALKSVWDAIVSFFTETIPEAFNNFITTVQEFVNSVITWFQELPYNLGLFIGEMIGHIIQFGIDAWNWVTTEVPKIIEGVINFVKELPGKIWTWLSSTFEKIKTFGTDTYNKAVEIGTNFLNNIINIVKDLPTKIWEKLDEAIGKVKQFATDVGDKATEAAKNICDNIINGITGLPGQVADIGRNIVEGLWNGISGAGGWIKEKVGSFAKGILDGMKESLGIHSPSTLFRDEVGKFIALGVGEGFLQNIGNVTKEMQDQLNLETGKISSNLNVESQVGLGNMGSNKNVNISLNFYPQKMTEAELDNAFRYINKKWGIVW